MKQCFIYLLTAGLPMVQSQVAGAHGARGPYHPRQWQLRLVAEAV